MTTYFVDFNNNTNETWTLAVYQELPISLGLESVAWKSSAAPKKGQTGVKWQIDYLVALGNYAQDRGIGVYKATQLLPAELGTTWEVVYEDGVQQLKRTGKPADSKQIIIKNNSSRKANPGIGMDGSAAVYKRDVVGTSEAQFLVTPTYYFGLFNKVELGEVISSNVIVGPKKLTFEGGQNVATVTADMKGEDLALNVEYSARDISRLADRQERIARLRSAAHLST